MPTGYFAWLRNVPVTMRCVKVVKEDNVIWNTPEQTNDNTGLLPSSFPVFSCSEYSSNVCAYPDKSHRQHKI